MKFVYGIFSKLEYKVRTKLSHYPIVYAIIGSFGVVIFWRGIWHTMDFISGIIFSSQQSTSIGLDNLSGWDGPLSILIGGVLLLATGLFVSSFIGNEIIISGLRGEKKLSDKTEEEVKKETGAMGEIEHEVVEIEHHLNDIEKDLKK